MSVLACLRLTSVVGHITTCTQRSQFGPQWEILTQGAEVSRYATTMLCTLDIDGTDELATVPTDSVPLLRSLKSDSLGLFWRPSSTSSCSWPLLGQRSSMADDISGLYRAR